MKNWTAWSLIGLSCGAVAVAGAVGFGIDSQHRDDAGSTMQTGVTITASPDAPSPAPDVESAAPSITGPAPLPTEEQGLPG